MTGIDARAALELNAALAASALVVERGVLYLRRIVELDGTPRPAIGRKLRAHAAAAIAVRSRLREHTVRRAAPPTLAFQHFSD